MDNVINLTLIINSDCRLLPLYVPLFLVKDLQNLLTVFIMYAYEGDFWLWNRLSVAYG